MAIQHPQHLDLGVPPPEQVASSLQITELYKAYAFMNHVKNGLASFQLTTDGLTGEDLFNHMLKFGTCDLKYFPYPKNQDAARIPSTWLDVDMKDNQVEVMKPKYRNHMLMEAVNDYGGQKAEANLVKKKLDMFENANSHCGMANGDKNLNMIGSKLLMAASIAQVYKMDESYSQENKYQ